MVNTKKLRGKIIERGLNYEKVAECLNVSSCTFGKKMRNISAFTLNEVEVLIKLLNIPVSEIVDYFLTGLEV
jgi:transcriptional regulator with XRE-family HTH domain